MATDLKNDPFRALKSGQPCLGHFDFEFKNEHKKKLKFRKCLGHLGHFSKEKIKVPEMPWSPWPLITKYYQLAKMAKVAKAILYTRGFVCLSNENGISHKTPIIGKSLGHLGHSEFKEKSKVPEMPWPLAISSPEKGAL